MDVDSGQPCAICWATAPPMTMPFHLMWHDELELRELRLFRPGGLDAEVRELVSTVASLKGVSEPQANAQFVSRLREQITAEAFSMALDDDAFQETRAPQPTVTPAASPTSPRPDRLHRLARAGAAVAMMVLVATGTELVSHLRNTEGASAAGHGKTILPHPH